MSTETTGAPPSAFRRHPWAIVLAVLAIAVIVLVVLWDWNWF